MATVAEPETERVFVDLEIADDIAELFRLGEGLPEITRVYVPTPFEWLVIEFKDAALAVAFFRALILMDLAANHHLHGPGTLSVKATSLQQLVDAIIAWHVVGHWPEAAKTEDNEE